MLTFDYLILISVYLFIFFSQLTNLVLGPGPLSIIYFVSYKVMESAREKSLTYLQYATTMFEEFFAMEVALLCKCEGTNIGVCYDGYLRAVIPQEALTVFLGKILFHVFFQLIVISRSLFHGQTMQSTLPFASSSTHHQMLMC